MTQSHPTNEIWILGASGRVGRGVAAYLVAHDILPVLVGRGQARLTALAASLDRELRTLVLASPTEMAIEIARRRPAVVINTVGPFTETMPLIARACLPSSHYLDLANDAISAQALLDLHADALAAGRTLVTGAGFGVLATESAVLNLCQGRPTPVRVRTDMLPSMASEAGILGEALASTIVDALPYGGRCYRDGRLVRNRPASELRTITLPDGSSVTSASVPFGELIAAQRASGAPNVVAASSELPMGAAIRALFPLVVALSHIGPLRSLAKGQLARVRSSAHPRPREYSWGHAVVQWSDGRELEGWLRAGDAMDFTVEVAANVALRLYEGKGRPGAYTPGALFGPQLAEAAGGVFMLPDSQSVSSLS